METALAQSDLVLQFLSLHRDLLCNCSRLPDASVLLSSYPYLQSSIFVKKSHKKLCEGCCLC